MNFKKQSLSRDEMRKVLGGDQAPRPCPVCAEDPWAGTRNTMPCVVWHCQQQTPPIVTVPPEDPTPCAVGDLNC